MRFNLPYALMTAAFAFVGCSDQLHTTLGSGGSGTASTASGGVMAGGGSGGTGGAPGTGQAGGSVRPEDSAVEGGAQAHMDAQSGSGGAVVTDASTATGGLSVRDGGPGSGGSTALDAGGGSTSSGGQAGANPNGTGGRTGAGGTNGGAGAGGNSGTDGGVVPKFVGNIDTRGSIRSDFAQYWNQFTPENAGKWGSVQGTASTFNWSSLDAMYKYCTDNGILFKEHTFIWGAAMQAWLVGLDETAMPQAVQNWMKSFCDRYPKTAIIDVVNEPPPHTVPSIKNKIGDSGDSGYDWIVNSFKWAREACPNAILLMNDYNNIEYASEHKGFLNIVKKIQAAGAPIDGIGAQAHYAYQLPAATVQGFIDDLADQTGLPVYITEFDINLADDTKQADAMTNLFTMFWNDSNVKGITVWGYIVGATWMSNTGLMKSDGTMRPAMTWLMGFLGR